MILLQGKEGIRGKHWFMESDLKGGATLKLDKTGKAILTVLRHLGRLTEVRAFLLCMVCACSGSGEQKIWQAVAIVCLVLLTAVSVFCVCLLK